MGQLSDVRIQALKPTLTDRWVGDGDGLWLRVRTSGSKTFVLRVQRGGRIKVITLGEWPGVALAEARVEALKVSADRAGHLLRPDSKPITVAVLAEEYFDRRIRGRYRRTESPQVYLNRLTKELGWRTAQEVQPRDVAAMVKAYAADAPVAANRFLSFCKAVFGYGVQSGALEASPADNLTASVAGGEEMPRDRVLTDAELRLLWHASGEHTRLLRLLLLTGCRIGEAQKASWSDFDIAARRWAIPVADSKHRQAAWIHLTDAALAVLGEPGEPDALALRCASETAVQAWMRRWCDRERITPRFTPHDLRRSMVSRLGDLGIAPHVVRCCINHVEPGTLGVYPRSDFAPERIQATERWAAKLLRIVGDARP